MTWCARCDEITTGPAGAECPSCGAPTLEATNTGGLRSGSRVQVLELEEAPAIVDAEIIAETPAIESSPSRRRLQPTMKRRTRIIASILVLAMAGGVYAIARPRPAASPATRPETHSTPTPGSEVVAPPLGEPAAGSILFGFQTGFMILDLRTGNQKTVDLGTDVMSFAPAPRGERIAYLDSASVLIVTTPYTEERIPIASEVRYFTWTPDGQTLIVVRSQADARGRDRHRIESISLNDRTPVLLAETYGYPSTLASNGGMTLVTIYEKESPNVYEVQPGELRLVRKGASLLDVSPDGRRALVATQESPSLLMINLNTLHAKRVGPRRFLASAAQFSRDGQTVAVTGTPHFTMELACEDEGSPCHDYPYASDQILWALDMKSIELRSIEAWSTPDVAGPPVWGPDSWVFVQAGERALAISMTDASRPNIDLDRDPSASWGNPAYLA